MAETIELTCPNPSTVNPLQLSGFTLSINKIPELSFWVQSANLPSIDLTTPEQATPFTNVYQFGDKPIFGDLMITFLVDEFLENYTALYEWIYLVGFPENYKQVIKWKSRWWDQQPKDSQFGLSSDGYLTIKTANAKPIRTIFFKDLVISNLGELSLTSDQTETQYVTCTASFKYTYWTIEQSTEGVVYA